MQQQITAAILYTLAGAVYLKYSPTYNTAKVIHPSISTLFWPMYLYSDIMIGQHLKDLGED